MTTIKTIRHWLNGVEQALIDMHARMAKNTQDMKDLAATVRAVRADPVPATKQLRTNLERVTLAYNDRERVLVKEIAEREAELADVRRARDATTAALMELDVDLPEIAVPDGEPWPAQMADAPHQDIYERVNAAQVAAAGTSPPWLDKDALDVKYGGARYVPHDAVRAATDQMQDAVEAARHE